jgi:hypothetical protein
MSNETSPLPASPTPPTPTPATGSGDTGKIIAEDIAAADAVLSPLITSFNPVIGAGIHLGLKLLSIAEPAVYAAVVATLQGTPLTADQQAALDKAKANLQSPEQYFA